MVKFTLRIALGNDTMKSAQDVARALANIAFDISGPTNGGTTNDGRTGNIRDQNGNTVGEWSFHHSPV